MQQTDTERQETNDAAHTILLSSVVTPGDCQRCFARKAIDGICDTH